MSIKINGNLFVILVCLTAGMGGFLFGFDTAVISGSIGFLREQFHLSAAMEGWLMSSALVGCVLGAAIAGMLADRYGRKLILLASAVLFILSAWCCAVAATPSLLVAARMVGGVGVGFAAMVAPMFISELASARYRGTMVSLYQLAITIGILASYLSNAFLLRYAHDHSSYTGGGGLHFYFVTEVWRAMLGSNMIPAFFFFVFLLLVPESPRWLIARGRLSNATSILIRINGAEKARIELEEIGRMTAAETGKFNDLAKRTWRAPLLIGLSLPFLGQLSGITTVMYYAPGIFQQAGWNSQSLISGAAVIGFFNMLFTLVAIWKIDKWGRRPMLMAGFIALSVALILIGVAFGHLGGRQGLLMSSFVFYIAFFAATLGPGVWVVISEIYPTRIRGRAMSIATLSVFLGSTVVTQTFPVLRDSIGMEKVFLLYGLLMGPAAWFVWKAVPETKGRSLEQIERYWKVRAARKTRVRI